jgi:mannose-6-phosphate isomerase-like protein (cupin superfamily)
MTRRPALAALAVLAAAAGAALAEAPAPPPVLDAVFPDGRQTLAFEVLAARAALGPGEDLRVEELARDPATSHHVVAIRDRETPHRHDRHDLLVVMIEGHGFMRLGDEERPVGQGSILYVPRGTLHAFRNAGTEPAVAYAVYLPAFDGRDRVVP